MWTSHRWLLDQTNKRISFTPNNDAFLMSYFESSNTCVLWCNDRGLMLYWRTWQVLGWILGVMYACKVPYCPSIDLIWIKSIIHITELSIIVVFEESSKRDPPYCWRLNVLGSRPSCSGNVACTLIVDVF